METRPQAISCPTQICLLSSRLCKISALSTRKSTSSRCARHVTNLKAVPKEKSSPAMTTRKDKVQRRTEKQTPALLALNPHEAQIAAAVFERFFPADENGPGAIEIGIVPYLDRALAGAYQDKAELYRLGLAALERVTQERYEMSFVDCASEQQD